MYVRDGMYVCDVMYVYMVLCKLTYYYHSLSLSFLREIIIMSIFAIDGDGLVVEKSSLFAGRMAFRSFSKTVRYDRESGGSSDGKASQCADSV